MSVRDAISKAVVCTYRSFVKQRPRAATTGHVGREWSLPSKHSCPSTIW